MKKTTVLVVIILVLLAVIAGLGWTLWKEKAADHEDRASGAIYTTKAGRSASAPRAVPPAGSMNIHSGWNDPFAGLDNDAWDPFKEMDAMQNMMNRMFRDTYNRGMRTWGPSHQVIASYSPEVDFKVTDSDYIATIDLPGLDKDKIDVKVQNHQLVISGQREEEKQRSDDQGSYFSMERSFGSFLRSIPLPPDASEDRISAESKNGVLTVKIGRVGQAPAEPKKVSIQ